MATNAEILDKLIEILPVENDNQLAKYLSDKYQLNINRQLVYQFRKSDKLNITQVLLREAVAMINSAV